MKTWLKWLVVVLLVAGSSPVFAQQTKETKNEKAASPTTAVSPLAGSESTSYYRLLFVLSEWENAKKLNSREYSMTAIDGKTSRLRTGTKVPVDLGGPAAGFHQSTYFDTSLNLDCQVHAVDDHIVLSVTADISSFDLSAPVETQNTRPLIRTQLSQVDAVVTSGKPVLLSSIDDPNSLKRYQLEVTVTKMK